MKIYRCSECLTEFTAEHAERCLKCGSTDIGCLGTAKVAPVTCGEAVEDKKDLPAVKEVLRRLCEQTYELTFRSNEWEDLIEEAIEELEPLLRTGCSCKG